MSNYTQDFRTLGVEPGCSLQSLKSARRRLVKSWHPDRFAGSDKDQAERRIKEINTAFDRLIEYHRIHGALPERNYTGTERTVAARSPHGSPTAAARPHEDSAAHATPRVAHASRNTLRWAAVVAGAALTATTIGFMLNDGPSDEQAGQTQEPTARTAPASTGLAPPPARYFTIGSSLGDVYAAQGIPSATEEGAWHYGKSTVYFSKGMVTGWDHDPANPLNATSVPISPKQDAGTKFFTFGSTKAEVRAIQGSPLLETDTMWDFGLSKVQFRDDRVIAWESSPMQPLRARK